MLNDAHMQAAIGVIVDGSVPEEPCMAAMLAERGKHTRRHIQFGPGTACCCPGLEEYCINVPMSCVCSTNLDQPDGKLHIDLFELQRAVCAAIEVWQVELGQLLL